MKTDVRSFLADVSRKGECEVTISTTRKGLNYEGLLVVSEDFKNIEFYPTGKVDKKSARRIDKTCILRVEGLSQHKVTISDFSAF